MKNLINALAALLLLATPAMAMAPRPVLPPAPSASYEAANAVHRRVMDAWLRASPAVQASVSTAEMRAAIQAAYDADIARNRPAFDAAVARLNAEAARLCPALGC